MSESSNKPKNKNTKKTILGIVIAILFLALGMEVTDTDLTLINEATPESILEESGEAQRDLLNCDDFEGNHERAQETFERYGGVDNDIYNLDGDNDGIACEELL